LRNEPEGEREFYRILAHYAEGLRVCKMTGFNEKGFDVRVDLVCNAERNPRNPRAPTHTKWDILESFDLSCCKCAYDGEKLVVHNPQDLFNKVARKRGTSYHLLVDREKERVQKYRGRGFIIR
jgi:hypothetical protein